MYSVQSYDFITHSLSYQYFIIFPSLFTPFLFAFVLQKLKNFFLKKIVNCLSPVRSINVLWLQCKFTKRSYIIFYLIYTNTFKNTNTNMQCIRHHCAHSRALALQHTHMNTLCWPCDHVPSYTIVFRYTRTHTPNIINK